MRSAIPDSQGAISWRLLRSPPREGEGAPTITSHPVWTQYLALALFGCAIMPILFFKFKAKK